MIIYMAKHVYCAPLPASETTQEIPLWVLIMWIIVALIVVLIIIWRGLDD